MAIYHFKAKAIQRSHGKNAVASAAYRHATKMLDQKEGQSFDYSNKHHVVHCEILIPQNAPQWLCDLVSEEQGDVHTASERLWNHVEQTEVRKDAQLAREFVFALPIELTQDQSIQLAREFIQDQFALRGMVADWTVHWDEGNPHVHVMTSMRAITPEGFGPKVREWNDKALLREWRQQWAEYANFHLRIHGHDMCIDHRSYQEQGIDLVPGIHLGKAVTDMERRGIKTNLAQEANWVCRENLTRIAANPDVLLEKMTRQQSHFSTVQLGQELGRYINDQGRFSTVEKGLLGASSLDDMLSEVESKDVLTPNTIANIFASIEQHDSVFSDRELAMAVAKHTDNAEWFAKAIVQLKASSSLIALGPGDDGRDHYTTKQMFDLENAIQHKADVLRGKAHVKISPSKIHRVLKDYQERTGKALTPEQCKAVDHLLKPSSISCVVGRAGTGKSFSLGAAREVWQSAGLKVYGVALSGIAADGLTKDAKIDSSTIESFRHGLKTGKIVLDKHSVVVMDEAGMTDSHSMLAVLEAVQKSHAKLALVGDHAQIQPVGPGASFRALLERLGFAELQQVYRQKTEWQRQATVNFSAGRVKEALSAYANKEDIRLAGSADEAMNHLVNDWLAQRDLGQKALSEYLVVAHRNDDVASINQRIRAARVDRGEIAEGYKLQSKNGQIFVAQGDRLLFLKNDAKLGVKNGRFATVQAVNFTETGEVIDVTVVLDGSQKMVTFNPKDYNDFALGYAATVHKVQGMTVDHAFVYVEGSSWNKHLAYVAMSRHRETCQVYGSGSYESLEKKLNRYGIKDSLLDYPLAFAERRGLDTGFLLKGFPAHVRAKVAEFREAITERLQLFLNPTAYHQKKAEALDKAQQATDIQGRRLDARLISTYVDLKKDAGHAWQAVQHKLYELGFDKMPRDAESMAVITATQEYQAFLTRRSERDAVAAQILQAPDRYLKAIEIYDLDWNALQKQAQQHASLERVKHYQHEVARGAVVHRDRLAAELLGDIQRYYPLLKTLGLEAKVLRQHAQQHARRTYLAQLSMPERQAFARVEGYQQQLHKIGAYYHRFIKDKPMVARAHAIGLEALHVERDRLAAVIVADMKSHASALQFNGLGFNDTLDVPTQKQMEQQQKAAARLAILQQHGKRGELRARVERYQAACRSGTVLERGRLATVIRQDTKGHYAAMRQLGVTLDKDFWLSIWQDEQRYQRLLHLKGLDLVERAAFKTVEAYMEAKRAHGQAWSECFKSKKTISEPARFAKMAHYAQRYSQARNALAHEIEQNPAWYGKSLAYFKLSAAALQPQAYTHQCQVHVKQFVQGTSVLAKAQAAMAIAQDTRGHYAAMLEQGIDWKMVYRHVSIGQRQALFAAATPEEKRMLRLIDDYRHASQQVGQYYAKVKAQAVDADVAQNKLSGLLAKRDAVAHRLFEHKDSMEMKEAFGEYQATEMVQAHLAKRSIDWDKVKKQAQHYTDKQRTVMTLSEAYRESLAMLSRFTEAKYSDSLIEGVMYWQIVHEAQSIETLSQQVLSQPQVYQALLQQHGLSIQLLMQRQQVIQALQSSVNQWRAAYQAQHHLENDQEHTQEVAARITKAKQIEKGSRPIQGTLAERYLREHRGIQGPIPDSYRFHPGVYHGELQQKCPALVVVAKNERHQTQAVQVIFLDKDTASKAQVKSAKLTYGKLSGGKIGVLANTGDNAQTIALAEGPETALSIADARPDLRVYAVLGAGNMARAPIEKETHSVLICADNDGYHSASQKKMLAVAEHYALQGINVQQALPAREKQDFNDVLKTQGVDAVKEALDQVSILATAVRQQDLEQQVSDQVKQVLQPNESISSLKNMLKEYVALSLEQTQLMSKKLAAMASQDGSKATTVEQMSQQDKALTALAAQAMKHPDMQAVLADKSRAKSLADLGGYAKIHERFAKGEFLTADIRTVSEQIRNKVNQQARLQSRDQSRGGRSQ